MNNNRREMRQWSTAEWYEKEKHRYSLNSPERPHHFNTLLISFRQTKFPDDCENQ
ncbi:hypothetical protein [Alteribacter natronophilus]|uniref:hypothetical protein n=1 Tax=Alteribacter natronophilus TaxID=2583810 RepID=UPI0014869077|nr:hypothetical protein [Alteribacter natronophilus]